MRVRGRGSGRVSMAGMACYKLGQPSRLIYAVREYRGRKDEPKGFGWRDFRDLIVRARIQLGGPIVLVWDNGRLHLTVGMREFIDTNAEWLTVFQLPTYAPDLNPTEGIWSLVKRDIGNLAAADLGQITHGVKRKLKMLPYRPEVMDGCLAGERRVNGPEIGRSPKLLVSYGGRMNESLPEDVADVLDLVLNPDEPIHVALRRQVPQLSVQSRCKCGCGTAYFDLGADAVEPAPTGPGTVVAANVQLFTETGECPGEVLVFAQGGYLSWLEICSWSDDVEVNLAAAQRWLQPSS
ncbi:transposase [Streptomyces arenae]|nr:transposase [Streptomyces arenae]